MDYYILINPITDHVKLDVDDPTLPTKREMRKVAAMKNDEHVELNILYCFEDE